MGKEFKVACWVCLCLAVGTLSEGQEPRLLRVLKGHADVVENVLFSPDGRVLASSDQVGDIRLWDSATGRMVHLLYDGRKFCSSMAFSPDSKLLATDVFFNRVIWVWDVATGKEIHSLMTETSAYEHKNVVAFPPDGKMLVSSNYDPRNDERIIFWDLPTGKIARIVQVDTGEEDPGRWGFLAFSPDCRLFAMSYYISTEWH